ncbi:MAG: hypothetical protein Q8S73_21225 [Deltaproteobacteria bacterium]|nr:hypothetical protein [Myxococcales bacterium]MDP3216646.1 hypothetical protein [Deltaproteobacteria bacterium]
MSNAPIAKALKLAGSKSELVSKVQALATDALWINRFADKDNGWARLSNRQLIRLHDLLTEVGQRFASRAELIAAIATSEGHGKDNDYKTSLERHPLPRLWDQLKSAERRARPKKASPSRKAGAAARAAKPAAAPAAKPAAKAAKPASKPAGKAGKASRA